MAADDQTPQTYRESPNGINESEIREKSAKAAQKARQAQRKAYELRQAANGAGDPEERQKLLEQAIDNEVEAESFGKMAKYMRRGSFQGMAVGAGLGVVPGLTLGVLTGTIVGGLVSTITGGLGAAGGALVGVIHGPFWNVGKVAGKAIQNITGDLPGWRATDEQKWYLEQMIGQAKAEDMPTSHELEFLRQDDGSKDWGSYVENASSWMSSVPSWMKSTNRSSQQALVPQQQALRQKPQQRQPKHPTSKPAAVTPQGNTWLERSTARAANQRAGDDLARHLAKQRAEPSFRPNQPNQPSPTVGKAIQGVEQMQMAAVNASPPAERGRPRKLEARSGTHVQPLMQQTMTPAKRKPKKLEKRT